MIVFSFEYFQKNSGLKISITHSNSSHIFTLAISKCYGKVRVLFFRATILISRGKSHISRVRGLMVRCSLFNPEVSCSNPWVCAYFFYKFSESEGFHFFRHYQTFRLCDFFLKFFKCPQRVLLSIFFDILQQNECLKSQRVPFFRIFGTTRLFKILSFCFFSKIF